MQRALMYLPVLPLLILLCVDRTSAQEKSFWELTHKTPTQIFGDTATQARRIQFYKNGRERSDMLDGAGGSHYALWGDIFVNGTEAHALWASSDGGLTWKEVLRSPHADGSDWYFRDISCPAPNHLYVLEMQGTISDFGRIRRSTDGGTTWETTTLPRADYYTSQGRIAMADEHNGFAMLTPQGGFFRTTDGWKTFEEVEHPMMDAGDAFCPEPDVYFVGAPMAYRSTDGGATWTTPTQYAFPKSGVRKFSFVDRDYGWAISGEPTGVGHRELSLIARTTDGGMTWTETYRGEEIMNGLGLATIEFADRMNGLIGGRGGIYRTTDGGETWVPEDLPLDQIGAHPSVVFLANPIPGSAAAILTGNSVIVTAGKTTLPAPIITHPDGTLFDSEDSVTLVWSSVPNATSYQVQMARRHISDNFFTFEAAIMVDVSDIAETSRFFQLDYGDWLYYFRVRAMNETDTSRWSTLSGVATRNEPNALATPLFITPTLDEKEVPTTIRLVWQGAPGATRYHLQVSTEPVNVPGVPMIVDDSSITDTTYLLSDLAPYTTYFCGVQSFSDAGTSKWSWQIRPHLFETGMTSGVNDANDRRLSFSVTPNPARGHARLFLPPNSEMIELFDLSGRRVSIPSTTPAAGPNGDEVLHLDLREIPSGMYILKIRTKEETGTERLFILP